MLQNAVFWPPFEIIGHRALNGGKNWLRLGSRMGSPASWVVIYFGNTARLKSLLLCQLRLCWKNDMTLLQPTEIL